MKEFSEFKEELKTTIFKDDLLDRLPFAESLYNLINKEEPTLQDNSSLVVAIDAPWGTGKTYFLDLFEQTLDKINDDEEKPPVIVKYNAWKNDDFDEPLLSVMYNLVDTLTEKNKNKIRILLRIKIFIKGLASLIFKAVKEKAGFDVEEAFEIALKIVDAEEANTFNKYKKVMNQKNDFIDLMGKLSVDKKVIVLIDELDRCRPTYAIELLEAVKHYLNVKNYIFIFALDKNQLSHSIKTQYGSDMDSNGYIRRFFDYVLNFPVFLMRNYCEYLLEEVILVDWKKNELLNHLETLAIRMKLSCRDMRIILKSFIVLWESILNSKTANHHMIETYIFVLSFKYKYPYLFKMHIESNIIDEKYRGIDDKIKRTSYGSIAFDNCRDVIRHSGIIPKKRPIVENGKYLSVNVSQDYIETEIKNYSEGDKEKVNDFLRNNSSLFIVPDIVEGLINIQNTRHLYAKTFLVEINDIYTIGQQISQQIAMIKLDEVE